MTEMKGDIVNRVRRLPKPTKSAEALQPLLEAVSNAIYAVDDTFGSYAISRGRIVVTIKNLKSPSKIEIIVSDNGIGLSDDRFKAFCTADTDFKATRGGKGIGRLLWLDAFERIIVTSVFKSEGSGFRRRSFQFQLDPKDQIIDEKNEPIEDPLTGTIIRFYGVRGNAYAAKFPSHAATVIRHFGSHFLAEFILGKSPQIDLVIDDENASFPSDVTGFLEQDRGTTVIPTEDFGELQLASFVCKKAASTEFDGLHQLHYVANGRTVTTRKLDGVLGIGRFGYNDELVYHGCV